MMRVMVVMMFWGSSCKIGFAILSSVSNEVVSTGSFNSFLSATFDDDVVLHFVLIGSGFSIFQT